MLRTAGDFQGLSIAAADGDIGSVRDLCFDDLTWTIRYLGREHATRSSRRWPRASVSVQGDPSLRSARDVTGYYIAARDGDIGHVDDFLVDDRAWAIRYLIVDTRNWWPGKKVALSPEWIKTVSWTDSRVHVDLQREEIKAAPEYDASRPFEREDETRLFEHYDRRKDSGRRKYWEWEER